MVGRNAGPVKIINGALDELPNGDIVLRGVVEPGTLDSLKVDGYQREVMPLTALGSIIDALKQGETLPDIELGMRGEEYKERNGVITLGNSVFIIDGLQRINAALHLRTAHPEVQTRIGAMVHFGTSREWERERFRILNTLRSKVSPNVILRNKREESTAIDALFSLCEKDKSFVLHDRVSWQQRMTRGQLLGALMLSKVAGRLHAHKAPTKRTNLEELVPALDKAIVVFGVQNFRDNTRAFFDLVDECWGIKRIQYKEGAAYIKGSFLGVLAAVLSDHLDFWRQPDEKKLSIDASLRRKIALFPVNDPQVVNLASSGGKSRDMLYMMMRDHINRGKRGKRLKSRDGDMVNVGGSDDEEAEATS